MHLKIGTKYIFTKPDGANLRAYFAYPLNPAGQNVPSSWIVVYTKEHEPMASRLYLNLDYVTMIKTAEEEMKEANE